MAEISDRLNCSTYYVLLRLVLVSVTITHGELRPLAEDLLFISGRRASYGCVSDGYRI